MIELETRDKIQNISQHYSKKSQWQQAKEEVAELAEELDNASNPLGFEDMVSLTGNTWSECADVIIMIAQLAMQHGKEDEVREQIKYKVNRQLERISQEQQPVTMTNADRIRAMSDKELADFLRETVNGEGSNLFKCGDYLRTAEHCENILCAECPFYLKWLQEPVEDIHG